MWLIMHTFVNRFDLCTVYNAVIVQNHAGKATYVWLYSATNFQ